MLKKKNVDDFHEELEQACMWLNIDRGRARDYVRLLEEFCRGERGSEHVLAYYEADEIVQLFELWGNEICRFPGLKAKLEQACAKGPGNDGRRENLQLQQQAEKRRVRLPDGWQVQESGHLGEHH